MDITVFRSISTVLCFIAIIAVFYWTYHPRRKSVYDDAANLPFSDDDSKQPSHSNGKVFDDGENK